MSAADHNPTISEPPVRPSTRPRHRPHHRDLARRIGHVSRRRRHGVVVLAGGDRDGHADVVDQDGSAGHGVTAQHIGERRLGAVDDDLARDEVDEAVEPVHCARKCGSDYVEVRAPEQPAGALEVRIDIGPRAVPQRGQGQSRVNLLQAAMPTAK